MLFIATRIFCADGRSKHGRKQLAQRPTDNREDDMDQAKAPEKLDPQDIVKLLVALRRAVKGQSIGRTAKPLL
ncbi:hypothetical protein ACW9ID_30340 [Pseudomonas gingeri]|nr:hypothetical protein [Pseudomonas gingeri]